MRYGVLHADGKNGQLVTFELAADAKRFEERFVAS
jgi:hypothetical protein